MNAALTLSTISGLLVAIVVLLLFFRSLLRIDLSIATAAVFVGSILCLVLALLSFLVEGADRDRDAEDRAAARRLAGRHAGPSKAVVNSAR